MNLFPVDLRILALCGGIYVGIAAIINEYQKIKIKPNKQCFFFFVLSVLLFEASVVWGIILICSDFSKQVGDFCRYMLYGWAVACFSFSCYVFADAYFNGDVSSEDKFEGKVMFGLGVFLTAGSILYL